MPSPQTAEPDNTAVRVALWRALHVAIDPPPHDFHDEVGLKLAPPEDGKRDRRITPRNFWPRQLRARIRVRASSGSFE